MIDNNIIEISAIDSKAKHFTDILISNCEYVNAIVSQSKFLGSGAYGHAYQTPDNKTFKMSIDWGELEMYENIRNMKFNYVCDIYSIKKVVLENYKSSYPFFAFIIMKEFIHRVDVDENKRFIDTMEDFLDYSRDEGRELNNIFFFEDDYVISDCVDYLESCDFQDHYIRMIEEKEDILSDIYTIQEFAPYPDLDIHAGNFGFMEDGTFKLFDISA